MMHAKGAPVAQTLLACASATVSELLYTTKQLFLSPRTFTLPSTAALLVLKTQTIFGFQLKVLHLQVAGHCDEEPASRSGQTILSAEIAEEGGSKFYSSHFFMPCIAVKTPYW